LRNFSKAEQTVGDNTNRSLTTTQYVDGVRQGDRSILSRAITLIESNAEHHQQQAQQVLSELLGHAGNSIRLGLTGVPGAGKSTFIETLGLRLIERGHRVAVIAVDPSSSLSKGSILGDKTRMELLSQRDEAFIRPSPSGGALGGVARKTRETIHVFEAAGYDTVIIETIGVGQSEIAVRSMVDFFCVLLIAGAGDELQGIKRGVIELADALVINKADGDNLKAAQRAQQYYQQALQLLTPATAGWQPPVLLASALKGTGIDEVWAAVEDYVTRMKGSGQFNRRRTCQARDWLHSMLRERVLQRFYEHPTIAPLLPEIERQVTEGTLPVTAAVWKLLDKYHGR
jgi:LAO/AO transport system kinase